VDGIPVEKGWRDADTVGDASFGDPGGNKGFSDGSTSGIFFTIRKKRFLERWGEE
jgi:hypothetical protein